MQFTKKVLKNGMRIITVPMKDNPTATVLVLVEAGSKYETKEQNGISHFLEHMCFKGTAKRPSASLISEELDGIGSVYNAFTSFEYTGYFAKADHKKLDEILDVVADMYQNPALPEEEIEKERGVVIEEINMYRDMPESIAADEFMKLLYGDQPAGWTVTGPKENIERMRRKDFIDYRNRHYVASATTVVVAGRMNEREVQKKVAAAFKQVGTWRKEGKRKVAESQTAPRTALFYKDTDQTHLVLGVRAFDVYNSYNPIIRVMQGILSGGMSGRLFKKLRDEMGICYYVRADHDAFTDHGMFAVAAGVDSARVPEAIRAIVAECKKLRTELVPKEELEKAKQCLIGRIRLGLESTDAVANFFGNQEILREQVKTPEDIIKEIRAVTASEIRFVAERIFKNDGLNCSIVGRFKDAKEFERALSF